MERSQSYTSFETAEALRQSQLTNNLNKNNKNNYRHNSTNDISNYYKTNSASTSSLNLRKALELRHQQLQAQQQQQQQRELLQFRQPQQQHQHQHQQQQFQQQLQKLQSATSLDELDAPLYLSTLNNFQLMRARRQKILQRQKSLTSNDDLDFQHDDDDDDDNDDGNDNDNDNNNNNSNDDYGVVLREHVYETIVTNDHNNNTNNNNNIRVISNDESDNELTLTAKCPSANVLPQKLLRFQRQRPFSDLTINYPIASSISPTSSLIDSPTITSTTSTSSASSSSSERRRLQQCDQACSLDSAISNIKPDEDQIMADNMSPISLRNHNFSRLKRDNSLHSDSSRYSSVDSLLEARKPDPEAILINLGFGPVVSEDILSRIPKRFLKPSQVRGIDTEAFVRRLQLANNLADHSVLGYRGLIGNPDIPPSTIVAKIMERFEVNERKKSMGSIEQTMR